MTDLHSHSTASDGSCTPERLVELALGAGLRVLALTDHDTLDGFERARGRCEGTALRLVPGVEIEIDMDSQEGEFHLLGLGLTGDRGPLGAALARVQEARRTRNAAMVDRLRGAGIPVSMEELHELAGGLIVSRAHLARALVKRKVVSSIDAAFKRMIGKGMPFYVGRACLELEKATALIRGAGGVAVVAHPVSLGIHGPALLTFLASCRDRGVGGIEAWHPNHTVKQAHGFERLARDLGMVFTGGSDFHGEHIPQRRLGLSAGGRPVPDEVLAALPDADASLRRAGP